MKEKKEKRKWGLILFIVFIMIGTSVSFVFLGFAPVEDKVKYKGIAFEKNNNIWVAKINGAEAAFSFLPGEVEIIPEFNNSFQMLQNKYEIDSTSDLNSTHKEAIALAQYQMGLTLQAYNIYLRKGFTANTSFIPPPPIITCNNATQNVPVLYFKYGNSTNIHAENNCIIAEANTNADFIKAKDRLLYIMLGVVK